MAAQLGGTVWFPPHQRLEHSAQLTRLSNAMLGHISNFFCERLSRHRRCMNKGEHGHVGLRRYIKYILTSYKVGQPVFHLMWLLYLADNHMYSVAYQQPCTCSLLVWSIGIDARHFSVGMRAFDDNETKFAKQTNLYLVPRCPLCFCESFRKKIDVWLPPGLANSFRIPREPSDSSFRGVCVRHAYDFPCLQCRAHAV